MSGLEASALAWLQEEENPSVRYLTLRGLLGRADGQAETAAAKAAIMTAGPVDHAARPRGPAALGRAAVKGGRLRYQPPRGGLILFPG